MLFLAEQAFVGRNEKRAPLKTPAWEAIRASVWSKNKWGGGGGGGGGGPPLDLPLYLLCH